MGARSTYYESQFDRIEGVRKNLRVGKIIAKAKDRTFEYVGSRGNRQCWLIAPDLGYSVRALDAHISEIPPRSRTGMHRHMCEAIIYILKGRGYSLIGDDDKNLKKYEWEEGDVFCVPAFFWHQHFNRDPKRPAQYYAVTANPMTESLGIAKFEHNEKRTPGKG